MSTNETLKPIWIKLDDGDTFEGHQGHWADVYFSNATRSAIMHAETYDPFVATCTMEITVMTEEQLAEHPEAIAFCEWLISQYGEY